MLHLYDKDKTHKYPLIDYSDYCIESILSSGDKTLSFSLPLNNKYAKCIENECYIRTKTDEFVIKAMDVTGNYKNITAKLNLEDLEGNPFDRFESVDQTLTDCLNLALAGSGWSIGTCNITKKRTIKMTRPNSLTVIQKAIKTYRVEVQFDTINKKINVYETLGSDKGSFLMDTLNLKQLNLQSNTYDLCTKLIAVGANDLTVTVTNNTYSNKVRTAYWVDERYTVEDNLREDAQAKLDEMAVPYESYSATPYNIKDCSLGDTIHVIDKSKSIKAKYRIVSFKSYPEESGRDSIQIANKVLSFIDIQKDFEDTSDTVNNITSDDGTISESAIKVAVQNLTINKADIQSLNAVTARVGTLEATSATITQLNATNANITNLQASKANVTELTASNARISTLETNAASINTLLAGNIGASNIKAGAIQAGSSIIATGAIGSAQISDLDVEKLNSGDFSTVKFRVIGSNGRLTIQDNRLQIFDTDNNSNLFERICIGDVNHDNTVFGMRIRGTNGTTILFDENGQTKEGFTDGYGKLSDNSLDPKKIDIEKAVTYINGATTQIQASKVQLTNSSLDVAFSNLNTTVTSQGQSISNNTTSITANTNAISLKLDTQTFNSYKSTNDSNITTINSTLSTQGSSITVLQNQISTKVSQTDVNISINNILIGSRNYILNSNVAKTIVSPATNYNLYQYNTVVPDVDTVTNTVKYYTLSFTFTQNNSKTHPFSSIVVGQVNGGDGWSYRLWYDSSKVKGYSSTKNIYTVTFSIDGTANQIIHNYLLFLCESSDSAGCTIYNIKLEAGTKATDVTQLAPEDMQSQIDSANGNISTLTTRITNAESSITQNTNSIALKVATSDFTTYQTTVANSFSTTNGNVTTAQNTANTAVTTASNAQGLIGVSSEIDTVNGNNKWLYRVFPIDNAGTSVAPTYGSLAGLTPTTSLVSDGTTLVNNNNTNYLGHLRTNVNVSATKTFTLTFTHDDEASVYVNGVLVKASNNYAVGDTCSITLNAGWNTIDFIFRQHSGGAGIFNLSPTIGSQVSQLCAPMTISPVVSAVSTLTSRVTTTESSISTLQNQIILKVSQTDIDTSINNIKIGVRNLVRNGRAYLGTQYWAGVTYILGGSTFALSNSTTTENYLQSAEIAVQPNTTYTIQFAAALDSSTPYTSYDCYFLGRTSTQAMGSFTYSHVAKGGATNVAMAKATYTFTTNADEVAGYIRFDNNGSRTSGTASILYVTNVKMETGTKATDYTDAQEDTQQQIDGATTRITNAESSITQNTNSIALKVNTTDFNSLTGRVTTAESSISTLQNQIVSKVDVNGVQSTISQSPTQVQTAFNTINSAKVTINASGLNITNGGFSIKNNAGTNVLSSDLFGNLTLNGSFTQYASNGNLSIAASSNEFRVYDREVANDYLGALGSRHDAASGRGEFGLYGDSGNPLFLGVWGATHDMIYKYMVVSDQPNTVYPAPITFMNDSCHHTYFKDQYTGNDPTIPLGTIGSLINNYFTLAFNKTLNNHMWIGGRDGSSYTGMLDVNSGGCTIFGNLQVNGTKNRIVNTEHFSHVAQNAYETCEPLFADVGEGLIGEDGLCYVSIDPLFAETINTDMNYQVFLQVYGEGLAYVKERNKNYFVVKGTPNMSFGWELKAHQKGYENTRLEQIDYQEHNEVYNQEEEETADLGELGADYYNNFIQEEVNYG